MSAISDLRELFASGFAVDVDYNEAKSREVIDLFKVVRDLGIHYRIVETFKDTWMTPEGDDAYVIDNWQYFGIHDCYTYLSDGNWTDDEALTVADFKRIVLAAQEEAQRGVAVSNTLDGDLVISGGIVVINYKDGSTYHLEHDGKATLNVANRSVITERTFLKDGQPAYERVIVKLESLESVQSDNLKLTVNEDGTKVDFTTTFTL